MTVVWLGKFELRWDTRRRSGTPVIHRAGATDRCKTVRKSAGKQKVLPHRLTAQHRMHCQSWDPMHGCDVVGRHNRACLEQQAHQRFAEIDYAAVG
ncbi:hypothetical protein AAIH46_04975 [Rhizobium sp. 0TCS1.26]|uniref:hypothetical protein n=1 Tax=Rhizobium sp. 0TCS1.26 TaxID=3142623 RepID=UPI003D2DDF30